MSQIISDFLGLKEAVQCQILEAALVGRTYSPANRQSEKAISDYWSGRNGNMTGTDSMFPFRVSEKDGSHKYTIHKDLHTYLNRLFIGFDVETFESSPEKSSCRSAELQEIIRVATTEGKSEVDISGVLKCEALARLLRYGMMSVEGPIEIDRANPFKGSLTFRISKKLSESDRKTERARLMRDADKALEDLIGT